MQQEQNWVNLQLKGGDIVWLLWEHRKKCGFSFYNPKIYENVSVIDDQFR